MLFRYITPRPASQSEAVPSWGVEIFTHFHRNKTGRWWDLDGRYKDEAEAKDLGKKVLSRIINADPHLYINSDIDAHVRTFQSDVPADAGAALAERVAIVMPTVP